MQQKLMLGNSVLANQFFVLAAPNLHRLQKTPGSPPGVYLGPRLPAGSGYQPNLQAGHHDVELSLHIHRVGDERARRRPAAQAEIVEEENHRLQAELAALFAARRGNDDTFTVRQWDETGNRLVDTNASEPSRRPSRRSEST
jgi:hypothetical protein